MLAKRLNKELKDLTENPITYCTASLVDNNITKWHATIMGPDDTPYAGGKFKLTIDFPSTYPIDPPKVYFVTKMFHCNIGSGGSICLDILQHNWSPALSISKVLISICSLLNDPNPQSPLNSEAARLYSGNRPKFDEEVKRYIKEYCVN
jgi:ubiquitin-conjugating enzyme E2 D/E